MFTDLLALLFVSSWQEEMTEKSLNEMLDEIIEETVLATFSNENENNSRVIYIKQDNITRRSHDSRLNTIHSSEYEDLEDLVHQIENSKLYTNHASGEAGHDITAQIERIPGNYISKDEDKIQDMDIISNEIPKAGGPREDAPNNKIIVFTSDAESNLIHKYPEIIIDKISYDAAENINTPKLETVQRMQSVKHLKNEEKKEVAAKTLNSLMKIIMKGTQIGRRAGPSKEKELDDVQRSTHIHNAYHNHVINNVPLPYSVLGSEKMSLGKLSEGYRDLQRIINRPRSSYLDPNLQLSRWGNNAAQNPLMSISRVRNRNRVHFIPNSLGILPRILYGNLFHHNYEG